MNVTLPRVAEHLDAGTSALRVTVFGSSTTEGYGASDPERTSYPAIMRDRLRRQVPGGVLLVNRGVSGETIDGMAARFAAVDHDRADLVILQAGSNDAPQGVPRSRFEQLLEEGICRFRAGGADVVLMEPQCCIALEACPAFPPFLQTVRALGERHALPVFPRYALMRIWAEESGLGLEGLSPDGMHMGDFGYCLLGEAVAADILRRGGLQP